VVEVVNKACEYCIVWLVVVSKNEQQVTRDNTGATGTAILGRGSIITRIAVAATGSSHYQSDHGSCNTETDRQIERDIYSLGNS
jgi:hypothetical protein